MTEQTEYRDTGKVFRSEDGERLIFLGEKVLENTEPQWPVIFREAVIANNPCVENLDVITIQHKANGSWLVTTRNTVATGLSATEAVDMIAATVTPTNTGRSVATLLADALDALATQHSSREASLAKTKIQEAMFWAAQAAGPGEPTKGV